MFEIARQTDGERSPICWLTHQMPTTARAKAWNPIWTFYGLSGPGTPAIICCLLDAYARSLISSAAAETGAPIWAAGTASSSVASCLTTCGELESVLGCQCGCSQGGASGSEQGLGLQGLECVLTREEENWQQGGAWTRAGSSCPCPSALAFTAHSAVSLHVSQGSPCPGSASPLLPHPSRPDARSPLQESFQITLTGFDLFCSLSTFPAPPYIRLQPLCP